MDKDTRNMKKICGLLHEIRRRGDKTLSHIELDEMIETAERIYHERKGL